MAIIEANISMCVYCFVCISFKIIHYIIKNNVHTRNV